MKFRKKFFMLVIAVVAVIMSCQGSAGKPETPSGGGSGTTPGTPGSGSSKEVKLAVKAGENGKVTIVQSGGNTITVPAGETKTLTVKEGSSVEITAESVNATGQKYLFDKWTSDGSNVELGEVITDLNKKPLDKRSKISIKLNNDGTLTAGFLKARKVTIVKKTENVAGVTTQAKGKLTVQYDRELPLDIENGSNDVFVPEDMELTINAVQDASDGYLPYKWINENNIEVTETYKKQYKATIPSGNNDLSYTVSFVQRYAIDNNGVLSIAHPKDADGNVLPDTEATELIIPKTVNDKEVTAIADNTSGNKGFFEGWTSLKKVSFPETLTTIGAKAFAGCTEISTVNFKGAGTFSIGNISATPRRIHMLFPSATTKLTKVIFGDDITAFNGDTPYFENCSVLEAVDLGKNNMGFNGKLPNSIFKGCEALKKVTLCDDIEVIGDSSFYGCATLERISIPKGVTSLLLNAFNGCEALTELDLRNVTTIDNGNVFSGCSGITKLIVNQGVKLGVLQNLGNLTGLTTIEVQTAEGVSEEQELAVNLSTLCGNTVQGNITSILIGDKVAIPTNTTLLTNLKNFTNAELKFSVPSEEWKTELKKAGIDEAKVVVR